MYHLEYQISFEKSPSLCGVAEVEAGEFHLRLELPEDKIVRAQAVVHVDCAADEKVFINGYQTWTLCPEYGREDFIRGARHMPKPIVKHFGIDRYGDYHFVDYPEKKGFFHGESWCYFRLGERYRLIASLDEKPGYTLFSYDHEFSQLRIERDCAGIRCGGEYSLFDLFFAEGSEDEVFDGWFAALKLPALRAKPMTGYSSWYNRYEDINEDSIRADLEGCAKLLQPGDLFQIDDGWEPAVGDWLETDPKKFPKGLKPFVDDIHARGLKAGLWLAPFCCCKKSVIYREHPDWLYKHEGKSWYCGCNWGGFYSLDIDNPQVVDYIERSFKRVFDDWGFDLVKLDFLYAAAPFGDEFETRAARMIRAMELLRRCCGDKLILGCGVPVMPAFGYVDYCRISCDVGLDWDNHPVMRYSNLEHVSTRHAILNSVFRRQLNGRAYLSDPDVFFLREDNLKLKPQQKHILATVNSLFGSLLLCSDNMGQYSEEARAQYAQLLRNREAKNIRVNADAWLSVSYELDGVRHTLKIE